tara:strand:- start:65 stop:397 length:333 start_codon:yes stop_codon:yes gene_type:complete
MTYPSKYTDAQVEVLGEVGAAKRISIDDTTSTNRVALESTTKRVSIKAVGADTRYKFGGSDVQAVKTVTPNTLCHYIADGERLDFACPEGTYIAAIAVSGTGALEITELT